MTNHLLQLINSSLFILGTTLSVSTFGEPLAANIDDDTIVKEGELFISRAEASLIIENMPYTQRQTILSEPSKFRSLLLQVLTLKKIAHKAETTDLDKNPLTHWRIQNAKNKILARALLDKHKSSIPAPQNVDELAEEYYQAYPDEFKVAERIKASHILLRVKKDGSSETTEKQLKKAKKILSEIKQGLDFSLAAKKFSEDTGTTKSGGDLGYFTHGTMVKSFDEAAFNLTKDNPLSDIVKTPYGFHIIKLNEHISASVKPYSLVKEDLIKKQRQKYITQQIRTYEDSFDSNNKNTAVNIVGLKRLINNLKANK